MYTAHPNQTYPTEEAARRPRDRTPFAGLSLYEDVAVSDSFLIGEGTRFQ